MFSLQEQTATLAHQNVRTERHGAEPAGGADLLRQTQIKAEMEART